ncbi:MAG TPA: hypothetical protein VNC22_14810, partial [Sporichthya sp.]|nr:hypothetical protein [Sporichthya sp.]
MLSGCGTRADDAEIRAGVGAGPVTLDQKSVDALRAVTAGAGGAATTGTPGAGPAGSGAATTGTAPGVAMPSGTPTSTTPGTTPGTAVPAPGTRAGAASTAVGAAACTQRLAPIALGQVGTFSGLAG